MSHSPPSPGPEIRILLKLHDPFVRIMGGRELGVRVPAGTTGAGLLRTLAERYPGFGAHLPALETDEALHGNILVVKGPEVLALNEVLADGDVIRIFPALAGG